MNKRILAIIGSVSLVVIGYFLYSLRNNTSKNQAISQNEIKINSKTSQIQKSDTNTSEQEIEDELNKIDENEGVDLPENIQ